MKRSFFAIVVALFICIVVLPLGWSLCNGCKGIDASGKEEKESFRYVREYYSSGSETIGGYAIAAVLEDVSENGVLRFPESYQGAPVIKIGVDTDEKRENASKFLGRIYKVYIPSSVRAFGADAFYGMENLREIVFEENSTLSEIEEYAFRNCSALTSVSLPKSVRTVRPTAFYNTDVQNIEIEDGNEYLATVDGVLTNKEETSLLCYPFGKGDLQYLVPPSVTSVEPYAFYGNKYLERLDLNNVVILRKYALQNTTALNAIQADSLQFVEEGALEGSFWLLERLFSSDAMITLGKVLLRYRGDSKVIEVGNVFSIAPRAFADNLFLEEIRLDGDLTNVGYEAFRGCLSLKKVVIGKNIKYTRIVYIGSQVFDDNAEERKIYVPQTTFDEYQSDSLWKQYIDDLIGYEV